MPKQVMIRDDLYERLVALKGNRSFSQLLDDLLTKTGLRKDPILEALETQNRLLEELLNEVRQLNRKLSGLDLEIKDAGVKGVKHVTGVTRDKKMPSYLEDNPWVEILAEKR
jgi:predicted CopG family antitoxin